MLLVWKRKAASAKNCYIEELSNSLRRSPKFILAQLYELEAHTGIEVSGHVYNAIQDFETWKSSTKNQNANYVEEIILHFLHTSATTVEINRFKKIIVALADLVLGIQRNADQVICLCCGQLMENNKQHNRKYCPDCSGYIPASQEQYKECVVCGYEFKIVLPNNRQVRCASCQAEEKRRLTRERVRKFRNNNRTDKMLMYLISESHRIQARVNLLFH